MRQITPSLQFPAVDLASGRQVEAVGVRPRHEGLFGSFRRACLLLLPLLAIAMGFGGPAKASTKKSTPKSSKKKSTGKSSKTPPKRPPVPRVIEIEGAEAGLSAFFSRLASLPPAGSINEEYADIVRVVHFGDSHVAADYWTGELRQLLQARFGDAGPGFVVPGRPWRFFRHARARSLATSGWETAGLGVNGLKDGVYGLSGTSLFPSSNAGNPASVEADFERFEVQIAAPTLETCISVAVDGSTVFSGTLEDAMAGDETEACSFLEMEDEPESAWRMAWISGRVPTGLGVHRIDISGGCGGAPRIFGTDLLYDRPGIAYDTLGINGAELSALAKWEPGLRQRLLSRADPALIVVSYGTNEMGRSDFSFEDYRALATELLAALRQEAPSASVLVTGPIDRGIRRRSSRSAVARNEPLVIRALREAAAKTGCAFWDAREAMGGEGSIARWAASSLAQRDLVHLTGPGYVKLANLLFERLQAAYDKFESRKVAELGGAH